MDLISYAPYLSGEKWPSHDGEMNNVFEMHIGYAANALQKLLRWARDTHWSLNIADDEERVEYVRRSPLGMALAARALGFSSASPVKHWYHPDPIEADLPGDIRERIVDVINRVCPDMDLKTAVKLTFAITGAIS